MQATSVVDDRGTGSCKGRADEQKRLTGFAEDMGTDTSAPP